MHLPMLEKTNNIGTSIRPILSYSYKDGGTSEMLAKHPHKMIRLHPIVKDMVLYENC